MHLEAQNLEDKNLNNNKWLYGPLLEPLPIVDNIGLSRDFLSMSFNQMQSRTSK